jgi:hypothetical protein
VLRTRWPWLGSGIAAVIWLPNIIWQATHGWPQLAMASALHQQNTSTADYLGGLPAQLVYLGLLVIPLTMDQHLDRRMHRPDGHLADAVATPAALRLTGSRWARAAGTAAGAATAVRLRRSAGHAIIGS